MKYHVTVRLSLHAVYEVEATDDESAMIAVEAKEVRSSDLALDGVLPIGKWVRSASIYGVEKGDSEAVIHVRRLPRNREYRPRTNND